MISIARILGAPETVPGREGRAQGVDARRPVAQPADHVETMCMTCE